MSSRVDTAPSQDPEERTLRERLAPFVCRIFGHDDVEVESFAERKTICKRCGRREREILV